MEALGVLSLLCNDPDSSIAKEAREGVTVGVEVPIPAKGLWPKETNTSKHNPDNRFEIWEENCRFLEDLKGRAQIELDRNHAEGFTKDIPEHEPPKRIASGVLGAVDEGLRSDGTPKTRIVWHGTVVAPNPVIWLPGHQGMPTVADLLAALQWAQKEGHSIRGLCTDYKSAFLGCGFARRILGTCPSKRGTSGGGIRYYRSA